MHCFWGPIFNSSKNQFWQQIWHPADQENKILSQLLLAALQTTSQLQMVAWNDSVTVEIKGYNFWLEIPTSVFFPPRATRKLHDEMHQKKSQVNFGVVEEPEFPPTDSLNLLC